MKSWRMRLQLLALLAGLLRASQGDGEVPASQLRMLSLGLAHLLQGVQENVDRMEQQGGLVAAELDEATKSLDSIQKQNFQTRRAYKQVRKEQQILSARKDRTWRSVRDLQDLEAEQETMKHRINRILRGVKSLAEPRSRGRSQLDVRAVKVLIDKQTRLLAGLTSEVSAREEMIDRRLWHIEDLEKQLYSGASSSSEGRFPPDHSCINTLTPSQAEKGFNRRTKQRKMMEDPE